MSRSRHNTEPEIDHLDVLGKVKDVGVFFSREERRERGGEEDSEILKKAPIVIRGDSLAAENGTAAVVAAAANNTDDDPFGIFGAAPPAKAANPPVQQKAPAPVAPVYAAAPPAPQPTVFQFAQEDPFSGFGAPAAPAAPAFDPFAGFAPTQPTPAPVSADPGWGFPDDAFSPPPAKPTAPASSNGTSLASNLDGLKIADQAPPLPTEGEILSRMSTRSLFVKDWSECFWIVRQNHLYLYRNKEDYKFSKPGEGIKKDITLNPKMRCLPIKSKDYPGFGYLYNFMLEEVEDYGANHVAKFASQDSKALEILYSQIKNRIKKTKELQQQQR